MNHIKGNIVAPADPRHQYRQVDLPKIPVVHPAAKERSDAEKEQFELRKTRTDLIEQMAGAERAGDRNLVRQLAQALCDIKDQLRARR